MNPSDRIMQLTELGQSLWMDNITRRMIDSGELEAMIERGDIRGITSNPTIFNQAIGKSTDYDNALLGMSWAGWDPDRIFWQLAVEDITAACDLFRELYDRTGGGDGFVSIEVNPHNAHDTEATISQVKELWEAVDRPNLMVKIPATAEGLPAIQACLAAGININITLIFSLERYADVMEAYLSALEQRTKAGLPIDRIASVASFFVSRVDTKVDGQLPDDSPLRGKAAIANAKLAYRDFQEVFGGARFADLREKHAARVQRPLWASTSTKNPAYPDTLYIDNLLGPDTVNTVPPQTLESFRDHGTIGLTLTRGLSDAVSWLEQLEAAGVSMARVTQELEDEGLKSFADSFDELLETINQRRISAVERLGPLAETVSERIARLEADSVVERLQAGDPALWTDDPEGQAEIRRRLGWLRLPQSSRPLLDELATFAEQVRGEGFTHALLLGMGGSSLAPEVMSRIYSAGDGLIRPGVDLVILDSIDPAQVMEAVQRAAPEKTLFILSSKSGGTAEVNALFDYFWARTNARAAQWVAITDPETPLESLARERMFRHTFLADSNVGGRYSALTVFGLLPAALIGVALDRMLSSAAWMAAQCAAGVPAARNPGLALGAVLGQAALEGRDKLTICSDPALAAFGPWAEQLIAESSGKQGLGIVPIVGESLVNASSYGSDRLFVYLRASGDLDAAIHSLSVAGHPCVIIPVAGSDNLGAEFYRWEVAVAVACSILGVNAFDQPDVQDAKERTRQKIDLYRETGSLGEELPLLESNNLKLYSPLSLRSAELRAALDEFLKCASAGDYIALNAFLPRSSEMLALLNELREALRRRTRCATMLGFGPRFLHSTGQLHKGGPDRGLFLEITASPARDIEIPHQGLSFGQLQQAQALGDYEALVARGRRILRVHIENERAWPHLVAALA